MNILLSVVIPAYNAERTIERCLKSVLKQTYNNIEIIVVNDGSTDSTMDILQKLIKENFKLTIIDQENEGPSIARNTGIKNAHGEYIAFLDSDDIWLANKVQKQLDILVNHPNCMIIGALSKTKKHTDNISYITFNKLLFSNRFITSSVICHRSVFESLQFNPRQKYSEDYRLWIQILYRYKTGIIVNDKLLEYTRFPYSNNLSSQLFKMEKNELTNYYQLYKENKISILLFFFITNFSLAKYLYRLLVFSISKIKEL